MKPGWGKTDKEYSVKGNSLQTNVKGDPPPGVSRQKWRERCARREKEDIDFWESLGFSRPYLEAEMRALRTRAGFANLAHRGQ